MTPPTKRPAPRMTYITTPLAGLCFGYLAIKNWDHEPMHVLMLAGSVAMVLVPLWMLWRSARR